MRHCLLRVGIGTGAVATMLATVLLLLPGVGIDRSEKAWVAIPRGVVLRLEVHFVDVDVVLAGLAILAETPCAGTRGDARGAWPGEERGAISVIGVRRVRIPLGDLSQGIVASMVEADTNGIGWEPPELGVPKSSADLVDVKLEWISANRVKLGVIVYKEDGGRWAVVLFIGSCVCYALVKSHNETSQAARRGRPW